MSEFEKQACFKPLEGFDCPEDCPGILASKELQHPDSDEYFIFQVCPNPSTLGSPNTDVNYSDGSYEITMHRDTTPTEEEYLEAARSFEG